MPAVGPVPTVAAVEAIGGIAVVEMAEVVVAVPSPAAAELAVGPVPIVAAVETGSTAMAAVVIAGAEETEEIGVVVGMGTVPSPAVSAAVPMPPAMVVVVVGVVAAVPNRSIEAEAIALTVPSPVVNHSRRRDLPARKMRLRHPRQRGQHELSGRCECAARRRALPGQPPQRGSPHPDRGRWEQAR